jgi:hypothetical protein
MPDGTFIDRLSKKGRFEEFARGFLADFLTPAFGARSKSEVDALVFKQLVACGAVDLKEPVYDIARLLNLTPTRVRSLILQVQLRSGLSDTALDDELRAVLQGTRFAKDGTLLTFGLENPLLKEHLIARLKKRGIYADASFAKEIVRLPVDAFVEFLDQVLSASQKKEVTELLVRYKLVPDKSFKGVAKGALKKLAEKLADKAGGALADSAVDRLTDFIRGLISSDTGAIVGTLGKSGFEQIDV